jgi:hypothetical protein
MGYDCPSARFQSGPVLAHAWRKRKSLTPNKGATLLDP